MNLRAVVTGALVLIGLEVFLTTANTGRMGSLLNLPATWARHLVDPTVPAIPDLTKH